MRRLHAVPPLAMLVLLVVILAVAPSSIMGYQLYRTTHRLSMDEAAIAKLQQSEIAENRQRINRKAAQVEVTALTQRVVVLESEVGGILARLSSESAAAPEVAPLDQRVADDEAQIATLTARIAALQGQPEPGGHPSQSTTPGPAGTATAAPRGVSRCLLLDVVECASGSG